MSGHKPLSFLPEGLKRFLHDMRRDVDDLKRLGSWTFDDDLDPDDANPQVRNAAHLLCMSATGAPITSGGDHVGFDTMLGQDGFPDVLGPSGAWTHPVSGVYVITYEHEWATSVDGGTIGVAVDGVVAPSAVITTGTEGAKGRGTITYAAAAGSVGQIRVTQTTGSTQTCDATVWVAISDPSLNLSAVTLPVQLAEAVPTRNGDDDEVFVDVTFDLGWYSDDTIVVANASDGTGDWWVDDEFVLDVTHQDGSTASYSYDFSPGGVGGPPLPPTDVTSYFETGVNTVRVRCRNVYPVKVGCSDIWLVGT